jgi:hypothetical protein
MKDWEKRLAELDRRLAEWQKAYAAELQRLRRERFGRGWFKRPSRPELEALSQAALAGVGAQPLQEASALIEELCRYYLEPKGAESQVRERALIRARVGQADEIFNLLWNWIETSTGLIRSDQDGERLRLTLAAIAIDDFRVDVEILRRALGRIWASALRAGLDPRAALQEIAAISNRGTAGGGAHLGEFLLEFESSPYFRDEVAPHLSKRAG